MKRFLLSLFIVVFWLSVNAAPKTWIGASGGLWSVAGNWSPSGVPATGDDITFNTSVTVNIDAAGPFAINTLTFTNNSTVIFSTLATRNFRFSSTSTINPALKIDVGSTFTFDAANAGTNNSTLDLGFGAAGVIGSIYGTLNITSSGGASTGIRLDTYTSATNYAILTVYSGGIIRIGLNTNTTVSSTTLLPVPTINMLNGSTYETLDNGGSFPAGNWEANSLARALSPGANVPQFNGLIYGNLEWNCPSQNNISLGNDLTFNNVNLINTNAATAKVFRLINSGSSVRTLTINGDLTISNNSILEITGASTLSPGGGKLHLLGNLNNSGTILTTGIAGTVNELELDGSSNQNITHTGSLAGARLTFIMNNAAGATLLSPVTLPGNLTLSNGKIKTTSTNLLTMVDNATCSGGSPTSFIEGPMKKIGDDDFIFPVGVGSIYAPLGIKSVSVAATNDEFTAEYVRNNPQSVHGTMYESPLDHISYVEYWTLDRNIGSNSTKFVSLFVNFTSFCFDLSKTYVSRYDGTKWTNEGSTFVAGPTSGSYVSGTITSTNAINTFTPTPNALTLSTDLIYANNPLPITLISFDASKLSSSRSSIAWELAACCSPAAKFEIQRAGSDKSFVTISTIDGSATNRFYNYTDNGLKNGVNYYRLKMTDETGAITYSRTVAIMNGVKGLLLTSLIPTVITNKASLTVVASAAQKMDIIIIDMQGRLVQKQNYTLGPGNTTIPVNMAGLGAGVYQMAGITEEGKTNTIRFIKQ